MICQKHIFVNTTQKRNGFNQITMLFVDNALCSNFCFLLSSSSFLFWLFLFRKPIQTKWKWMQERKNKRNQNRILSIWVTSIKHAKSPSLNDNLKKDSVFSALKSEWQEPAGIHEWKTNSILSVYKLFELFFFSCKQFITNIYRRKCPQWSVTLSINKPWHAIPTDDTEHVSLKVFFFFSV